MILLLFLLMPAAACFGWILLNFFISRRTTTYGIFTLFLIMLSLFLVTDSSYANPDVNPELLVWMTLVELLAGPCLIPLMWMYLYQLMNKTKFTTVQWSWVVIPIVFITASALITHLKGVEPIADYLNTIYSEGHTSARVPKDGDHLLYAYYLWTFVLFRVVIGTQLVLGFVMLVIFTRKHNFKPKALLNFWRKGEAIPVLQIQFTNLILPIIIVIAKIAIGNRILQHHPELLIILSLAMAAAVFNVAFTALFGAKEKVTLESMRHVMVYNYNDKIKSIITEFTIDDLMGETEDDGLRRVRKRIDEKLPDAEKKENDSKSANVRENLFASMSSSWDEDSLLSRFQTLMMKEKLFLQPSLTLGDVADRLHTNKTYVSKLVNNTYNLGFPELLNTLRIDYAEQYIISHKDARQDEIATACGFLSASSFNSIFKKVTGVTPKMWIAGVRGIKPE